MASMSPNVAGLIIMVFKSPEMAGFSAPIAEDLAPTIYCSGSVIGLERAIHGWQVMNKKMNK